MTPERLEFLAWLALACFAIGAAPGLMFAAAMEFGMWRERRAARKRAAGADRHMKTENPG